MIYTQITNSQQFAEAFLHLGRGVQFTLSGFSVLFKYLEESEQDIELDVIALCCDFAESSVEELLNDYEIDIEGLNPVEDAEEVKGVVRAYLEDNTIGIGETPDGLVYGSF